MNCGSKISLLLTYQLAFSKHGQGCSRGYTGAVMRFLAVMRRYTAYNHNFILNKSYDYYYTRSFARRRTYDDMTIIFFML